jgi:hypothetical protein
MAPSPASVQARKAAGSSAAVVGVGGTAGLTWAGRGARVGRGDVAASEVVGWTGASGPGAGAAMQAVRSKKPTRAMKQHTLHPLPANARLPSGPEAFLRQQRPADPGRIEGPFRVMKPNARPSAPAWWLP